MPVGWRTAAGRRRVMLLAAVVVASALIAIAVAAPDPPPTEPEQRIPPDAAASDLAGDACRYVTQELADDITDDAPAEEVLARVTTAASRAREAAARDQSYIALAGGVGALREALRTDDADAAAVAMRVVIANCP